MACKCCQQYAPKHHDGSPQGPCPGDAALKEARDLARLWHGRAKEAGWLSPKDRALAAKTETDANAKTSAEMAASAQRMIDSAACGPGHKSHDRPELKICLDCGWAKEKCTCDEKPLESKPAPAKKLSEKHPTKDELLHDRWISEGKKLAYCQGPRRHFFIVGSKMHEQLIEAGCFHCGSYPELVE